MGAQELALDSDREFVFTNADFQKIREFVKAHTGINLSEAKQNLVYGRLSRRLRQLNMKSFKDYLEYALTSGDDELGHFINAITTNLTAFFREEHHFAFLASSLIPQVLKQNERTRRLRVWSAGCSTGEEPYSLAMTLMDVIPNISSWDVKILATDLDTNVLAHASAGVYDLERARSVGEKRLKKYFRRGRGENGSSVKVSDDIRQLIMFKQLNLMAEWPMRGPFDFMFCRNVVIYFDKDTQRQLVSRYADLLREDGHLFLGHSESLFKVSDRFELLGQTIYKRVT